MGVNLLLNREMKITLTDADINRPKVLLDNPNEPLTINNLKINYFRIDNSIIRIAETVTYEGSLGTKCFKNSELPKMRVAEVYKNGEKKWQIEGLGLSGLWFPMGREKFFNSEAEALEAKLNPHIIYT